MKFILFVATLLAVAAAEHPCHPAGLTYQASNGWYATFGDLIGVWTPVVFSGQGQAFYFTLKPTIQNNWTNYDVKEWSNPGAPTLCGSAYPVGVYELAFSEDCSTVNLVLVNDNLCNARAALSGLEFTKVEESECLGLGSFIKGQFASSEENPSFSAKAAHVAYGSDGFVVVTAHDIAVFQQWTVGEVDGVETITIVDLLSIPHGHTCDSSLEGVYSSMKNSDSGCGLQTCGVEDPCLSRRTLWNGAKFNAYRGDKCQVSHGAGSAVNPIFGECSDGRNWRRDPDQCFNQIVAGGCVYCEGIINGDSFTYCITRQSKDCRVLFEEQGVQAYCNLAYECTDLGYEIGSSSFVSVSFAVLLVTALFGLLA